jgi:TolB-like protein
MADVFISYARSSETEARTISEALITLGYRVWRDDQLPAHRAYAEVIEERLIEAKAVVVLWSKEAARSQWVRAEADVARGRGTLVQAMLDAAKPPLPFNQIQCCSLIDWAGDSDHHDWRKLTASIDQLINEGPKSGEDEDQSSPAATDRRPAQYGKARRARLSIVVLPFANMSRDPEQEYFVDGVTESLTTDLSRIHGSFVIARNTAFTFKGKSVDITRIGEELNVRYALEGSVQRGGDRVRVNVQLVSAETGAHLWAERFDKPVEDIFEMQDQIVSRLARALDVQLVAAEARSAAHKINPDSMDLYFQGQAVVNQSFGVEEWTRGCELFERALALDAANVDAMAALAYGNALAVAMMLVPDSGHTSFAQAEKTALKAVETAPGHAKAHLALGLVYSFTDRAPLALSEYQRALELDRNFAPAYAGIALANVYCGMAEKAEGYFLECFRLSPKDNEAQLWCLTAGTGNMYVGKYVESEAWLRKSLQFNRTYPLQTLYLAGVLAAQDKMEEARATAEEALALNPRFSIKLLHSVRRASNPIYVKQLERMLDYMRKAGIPEE